MKTITTFAAVAALIAGVGIASAQNSQGPAAANPKAAGKIQNAVGGLKDKAREALDND